MAWRPRVVQTNYISIVRSQVLQEVIHRRFKKWRPVSQHQQISFLRIPGPGPEIRSHPFIFGDAGIDHGPRYRAVLASGNKSPQSQHPRDLEKIPAYAVHVKSTPFSPFDHWISQPYASIAQEASLRE